MLTKHTLESVQIYMLGKYVYCCQTIGGSGYDLVGGHIIGYWVFGKSLANRLTTNIHRSYTDIAFISEFKLINASEFISVVISSLVISSYNDELLD